MPIIDDNIISIAAQFLISRVARPIILEVEVRNSKIEGFVEAYNDWTGERQDWANISADGHALDVGEGKWGVEARIYFSRDDAVVNQMRRYGYKVDNGGVRVRNSRRINNRRLFQELVSVHGLRIGYND